MAKLHTAYIVLNVVDVAAMHATEKVGVPSGSSSQVCIDLVGEGAT